MVPCSCLSPVKVFNKALGTWSMVACGHCAACNVLKGYSRVDKVNAAFDTYKYRYFVTLTYRDETLPLAKYDEESFSLISNDCDYNGECYQLPLDSQVAYDCKDFILDCVKKYGGVPVVSHRDMINFKKRFRKYVRTNLGFYPKIFIYLATEYGPLHFRPHAHFEFGFNEPKLDPIFRECIYQAWTMYRKYSEVCDLRTIGKIDIQRVVNSGVTSYCTQYLNCTSNLPRILSCTKFRPFHQKTRTSDFELHRSGSDNLRKVFYDLPITETKISGINNTVSTTVVGALFKNKYFPKCPLFSQISFYDRVCLYRTYEQYCQFSAKEFATFAISDKYRRFFVSTNLQRLLDLYFIDIKDYFKSFNKLVRLYYVSRRVYYNASSLGVTTEQYVQRITDFYDKLELDKLSRFYHYIEDIQNDKLQPATLRDIYHLYYNTFDKLVNADYYRKHFGVSENPDSQGNSRQLSFSLKMLKIVNDTTKTKKRNDDFEYRGIHRTPYLCVLSKNKQKLLKF